MTMTTKQLNYWMYRHACLVTDQPYSDEEFELGYENDRFHFTDDAALLGQLVYSYTINLHSLGDEWLALGQSSKIFAAHPMEAVCRVVVDQTFKDDAEYQKLAAV